MAYQIGGGTDTESRGCSRAVPVVKQATMLYTIQRHCYDHQREASTQERAASLRSGPATSNDGNVPCSWSFGRKPIQRMAHVVHALTMQLLCSPRTEAVEQNGKLTPPASDSTACDHSSMRRAQVRKLLVRGVTSQATGFPVPIDS
jgi:hypothetical protein